MNQTLDAGTKDRLTHVNEVYFSRRQELDDFNLQQTKEINFALAGEHWNNEGRNRDGPPSRIQPVGMELKNALLYLAGDIASSEIYLDVIPQDRVIDPVLAELCKGILRRELDDPLKLYADLRYRTVLFALAGRMAGLALDFDPNAGSSPFGETLVREIDGRRTFWPAGFHTPHDLKCPWWVEVQRLHRETVRRHDDWKNNQDVEPDSDPIFPLTLPGIGHDRGMESGDFVTVVRWWERDRAKKKVRRPDLYRKLKPNDRHMACGDDLDLRNGCGFRSSRQEVLGFELPEHDPQACPDCAKRGQPRDLWRIDAVEPEEEYLVYPKGRLTIFQPGRERPFYDDAWPQKLRSFPCLIYRCRDMPGALSGESITSEFWTRQVAVNVTDRVGMEHLMKALPYMAAPDEGLRDYNDEDWYGGEEQGLMIRYPAARPKSGIELIQAAGIPAGWPTVRREWLASYQQTMGTRDMPMDAGKSADIAVGTMEAFERIRAVPTEEFISRLRREESIFFGVWWDMLRDPSTNASARLARWLGPDGQWKLQALDFGELPGLDIAVTASPNLSRLQRGQAEAMVYIAQQPAHIRKWLARGLNIPISQLRELEQDERAAGMSGAGSVAQPGMQGGPGLGGGAPAPNFPINRNGGAALMGAAE